MSEYESWGDGDCSGGDSCNSMEHVHCECLAEIEVGLEWCSLACKDGKYPFSLQEIDAYEP